MKVYIDGQEYQGSTDGPGTADILAEVGDRVSKDGRVITEIRVDGIVMDEEAFLNLTGGLQAHFTSQPVRDLVRESLDEASRYIPRLTRGLEEIAAHFEGGDFTAGEKKLANAADGLDWLLTVFYNCSSLLAADRNAELEKLKETLNGSISLLGAQHEEKKYLQMALCIRQRLLPEIGQFSLHIRRLHDLSNSTQ